MEVLQVKGVLVLVPQEMSPLIVCPMTPYRESERLLRKFLKKKEFRVRIKKKNSLLGDKWIKIFLIFLKKIMIFFNLGFYKGITPILIGNYISYGVYFFWYELFKFFMKIKQNDFFGYCKIAFFSGIIASTCTNPFWVINANMMVQKVIALKF